MPQLKTFYKTVKDYLFPVFCLSCNEERAWVCERCMPLLEVHPQLFCPACHEKTEQGETCARCHAVSALMQHVAMMKYVDDALVGKLVHVFKYQYAEEIMIVIKDVMVHFVQANPEFFQNVDTIIPVPLHKKRFAERGFNQASHIAKALSDILHIPMVDNVLIRSRYTPHQAHLDRDERKKNVEEAFHMTGGIEIVGQNILLVDDVYTTGATMQACALALGSASVKGITGFSLARG